MCFSQSKGGERKFGLLRDATPGNTFEWLPAPCWQTYYLTEIDFYSKNVPCGLQFSSLLRVSQEVCTVCVLITEAQAVVLKKPLHWCRPCFSVERLSRRPKTTLATKNAEAVCSFISDVDTMQMFIRLFMQGLKKRIRDMTSETLKTHYVEQAWTCITGHKCQAQCLRHWHFRFLDEASAGWEWDSHAWRHPAPVREERLYGALEKRSSGDLKSVENT